MQGLLNSPGSVEAIEFYKELYQFTPPDWGNTFFIEANQAITQGQVAMAMNYFAFFPALTNPKINPHAKNTGYFANPAGPKGRYAALGGQGMSINSYISDSQKKLAWDFLEWFVKEENQYKWAEVGGFTCNANGAEIGRVPGRHPVQPGVHGKHVHGQGLLGQPRVRGPAGIHAAQPAPVHRGGPGHRAGSTRRDRRRLGSHLQEVRLLELAVLD